MAQPRASSGLLRGFDIDEASDKPVAEQLRDALSRHAVRVIDLFREWDEDGSGAVSKAEFHEAMARLGLQVPHSAVDVLFDSWDPDRSGKLVLAEIHAQLRRGAEVHLDAALQAPVCPLAGLPYACQHIRGSAVHRCKPDSAAAGGASVSQLLTPFLPLRSASSGPLHYASASALNINRFQ